jgi:hypothetical protein
MKMRKQNLKAIVHHHAIPLTSQTNTGHPSELDVVNWQSTGWLITDFPEVEDTSHVCVSPEATPRFKYHAPFPILSAIHFELTQPN